MTLRRLSQCLALALAAFTWWVIVSLPDVIEPAFAVELYVVFGGLVAIAFGVAFIALRLATAGSAVYWSMQRQDQVRPVLWMELTLAGVILSGSVVMHGLGRPGPASAMITYLLAGALVPAAFLHFGLVTWPTRLGRPGRLKLVLIGMLALGLAAAWTYAAYSSAPDKIDLAPVPELIVSAGALVVGATAEEVLFRVLLLTALLDRTGSRFQAVFLSSVAFGLIHVPGALMDPVLHSDWPLLKQVAVEYAPEFLMQTFGGLLLGVLWLRTGSITLIALTHAVLNLGKVLAYGLLAYG